MIEIIPNWHPVFVHFTVALLTLAVGFHILCPFLPAGVLRQQFEILARWNLWLGTGFGIITAITGWFAFNSVTHDALSHVAMTDHRNWALATLIVFVILSVYSLWCIKRRSPPGLIFLGTLMLGGLMLVSTAWRGAEVVYQHGIGVMSLPQSESGEHDHASHDHAVPDNGHNAESLELQEAAGQQDESAQMHPATGEIQPETESRVPEETPENHDHANHVH
jgi:uncharacterized membrane protein